MRFLSAEPEVKLVRYFSEPYNSIITAARTCYSSKGIIYDDDLTRSYDGLVRDIYQAGHHTTFQHAQFQFAIWSVSRHAVWSFLHSHPFYNSEQVSQRYVPVKKETYARPPLSNKGIQIYDDVVQMQTEAYDQLRQILFEPASEEFFRIFPGRLKDKEKYSREIDKKSQETARYVLPVATHTYLYHTISALTLLRYVRISRTPDTPTEQQIITEKMVAEVLKLEPRYESVLAAPIDAEELAETTALKSYGENNAKAFREEFDEYLGGLVSRLADRKRGNQGAVASAVREVLGLPKAAMNDETAIGIALDPAVNRLHGEVLNLSTHGKLTRALHHASYTFKKKLSHTADSQDQRHRMTPASRPMLTAHLDSTPDYVTPELMKKSSEGVALYRQTIERTWKAIEELNLMEEPVEFIAYLLPNAVSVRFTESSDLLNLYHKHTMRLCYNAQEEIWRASLEEARQISEIEPIIGRFLLPPCSRRKAAGASPYCPEGSRYCGVPVWNLDRRDYSRII